jgi:hypothetical protein
VSAAVKHSAEWRASDHPEAVRRRGVLAHYEDALVDGEPGPGATARDDGLSAPVHMKSVRNLPTGRLERALVEYHSQIHTAEGLGEFDAPRRALVENGIRVRAIAGELRRRGRPSGPCRFCWGRP